MELSSITDKLVRNLQRAQLDQIMTITKVLGLKVGSQFVADVQKVTQATPEERAQLVKSIEANLAQLNKNSAAPAIQALIKQLEAQKNIAQAPNVKLVTLSLNTPALSTIGTPTIGTPTVGTPIAGAPTATTPPLPAVTTLLTYTTQPIQIGQTLLMQLGEGQRLQLLQPLTKAEVATFNALLQATTPTATTTSTSTTAGINPSTTNSATNVPLNVGDAAIALTEQHKLVTGKITEAIGDTLRRLLPQKDKGQDLLASLPKITQFIQQLPLAERKEWLSSQVQQSLKTLANHIRVTDQLTNPKLLEVTLKNNGQSFEHKLAQLTAGLKNNELSLAPASPSLATHKQTAIPQVSIEKMAAQDLKGALLGLLHELDSQLEPTKPALPGMPIANEFNKNLPIIALPQFLGLLANKQQGELNQKQLRTQLVMLMHQYTLGSIAKIQLQQMHTLNHQLGQADQAQPTSSWQFEIPVRHGHEVHPLHIQMEQQWIEEQSEHAEQNTTRVRQWNVMLGFNLPLIGQFYAQLILLGNNLSTKFWAEHENTLLEAKNKMDGLKALLENEGIQVTQMQCVPGLPAKPKVTLSYSLVDIKT